MTTHILTLIPRSRAAAIDLVRRAPDGYVLTVSAPRRTPAQNRLMWKLLACWEEQMSWPVNGHMLSLSSEDWKDLLTATMSEENMRMAPSLTRRSMVLLGQSTSGFDKGKMHEFIEYIQQQAAEFEIDLHDEGGNE